MSRVRTFLILTLVLAAACIPALAFNEATPTAQRNAILFSWDGAQRDHVNECLKRGELPNLAKLIAEGKTVKMDVTSHSTDTKAGHTQMLTGYDPDVTGVMSNGKFRAIPAGYSIFERLDQTYGKDKVATIMLTAKTHHVGACPPSKPADIKAAKAKLAQIQAKSGGRGKPANATVTGLEDPDAATQAARKRKATVQNLKGVIQNTDGEPFLNTAKALDVWDGEKGRTYDVVGPLMLGYLDKYSKGRFFAFFHYSDPDHMGHNHGENSKEYNDAIISCDKMLGECLKKLKTLGIYDKTMVFVTADHGFDEGKTSHSNAPYVFLASNLKTLARDGDQRDLAPTILKEMGVDVAKQQPKYKGAVLTK